MKDLGGYAVVQVPLRFVAQLLHTKNQGRRDNTSADDFRSLSLSRSQLYVGPFVSNGARYPGGTMNYDLCSFYGKKEPCSGHLFLYLKPTFSTTCRWFRNASQARFFFNDLHAIVRL